MSEIISELESLDGQFSKYDKIVVPQYQRSYAWDQNNVLVFWEDIKDSITEGRDRYFIGPIVTKATEKKNVELIDGQQRLTTSLALISIIRRMFFYKYKEDTENNLEHYEFYLILKGRFEVTNSLSSNNGNNRYEMNEENMLTFNDYILKDASKEDVLTERKRWKKADSNYKLLDSVITLWDALDEYVNKNFNNDLLRAVAIYVLEKLQVLNISVADESDAYLIFETINDRGRELDTMDLVKNLLFSKVQGSAFEKIKSNWIAMNTHLSTLNSSNEFLNAFWIARNGKYVKTNLFSLIKEDIKKSSQSALSFSEDIKNAARVYSAIGKPTDSFWDDFCLETRGNLGLLRTLSAKAINPIIMAALIRFDKEELNKLLRYLVVFQVRYVLIAENHTGKYSKAISLMPLRINDGTFNKAIKVAKALKNEDVYVNDQDFLDAFYTYSPSTKKAKFLLASIEGHSSGNNKIINPNSDIVNIEHILPETSCEEWNEEKSGIGALEYETWSSRLGNLVLSNAKLNKAAKQHSFEKKKEILFSKSEDISMTFELMNYEQWTKTEITERQEKLAKLAVKIWSIDF